MLIWSRTAVSDALLWNAGSQPALPVALLRGWIRTAVVAGLDSSRHRGAYQRAVAVVLTGMTLVLFATPGVTWLVSASPQATTRTLITAAISLPWYVAELLVEVSRSGQLFITTFSD